VGAGGGARYPGWLDDPNIWARDTSLPDALQQECQVYRALLPNNHLPRRTWQPCGPGCQVAPAVLPGLDGAFSLSGVVASPIAGEMILHVSSFSTKWFGSPPWYGIDELRRLPDGEPLLMVRRNPYCVGSSGRGAPLLFVMMQDTTDIPLSAEQPPIQMGLATTELGAPLAWQPPGFPSPHLSMNYFDFDGGWGVIYELGYVQVATTPGSAALQTVYSSLAYQLHPFARGPLVTWSDFSQWSPTHRAVLRSWSQARGTEVLASGPYDVMYSAISDSKVVWLGAYGLDAIEGAFETAQLFWSPFTTDPSKIEIHAGPMVPDAGTSAVKTIATHGDLAALTIGDATTTRLVVANLLTDKLWLIPGRPCCHFNKVMAMDDKEILVQEFRKDGDVGYVDHIVRIELAKLDELSGGAW